MTGGGPPIVPPARRGGGRHPLRRLLATFRQVEARAQTEQGCQAVAWWTVYLKGMP